MQNLTFRKLSEQHKDYNDAREAKKKTTKQRFDKMRSKWSQSERLVCTLNGSFMLHSLNASCIQDTEAEDLTLKIEDIKKNEKNRARRIKNLQVEIAKMTSELETPLQTESTSDLNDELVSFAYSIPCYPFLTHVEPL
jgi:hypothetical protein